jgi:putative ABC transport system permease protein
MIVIASQVHYAKQSDLGFNKEAIVMVPLGLDSSGSEIGTLRDRLSKIAGVEKVSVCFTAPYSGDGWGTSLRYENRTEDEPFLVDIKAADDQYIPTFGIELAAGRNLYPSDTVREFVVNETLVRKLGIRSPAEALGKRISINGDKQRSPIVGVVKDFHNKSFHSDITAVCICTFKGQYNSYAIKLNMNSTKTTLAAIAKTWNGAYPTQVYDMHFLDEQIAEMYGTEETMLQLIQAFALIAIFIGCLGLYGLVMFMAAQKTREIGIRKVLGSSIGQILWIFGKEFSRLILIAFLVAAPLAGWLMHNWLENFKFHVPLSPLFFTATIGLMFLIAFATVSYQAIRAALTNPAKSLKSE